MAGEHKAADPSYWAELLERVHHGWAMEVVGAGKRHLIGRFEAIRELGEGGYGLVLLVRDPELDREVALKLCRVPRPGAGEAILREAQVLAKLSHPNIITVHETGRYGDDVFYVMERIVGMSGHAFIDQSRSWQDVIRVYVGAGTGLAVAHERGIIHGDFKPGNILIPDDGGPVRVADFGLARVLADDGEGNPHRIGTMPYMAPEVLRGQAGDAASDQWSFCVALWQTLDTVLPYSGETADQLLEAIEHGEPQVAEAWVPDHVRALVRVGLSVNAGARHPDMRTLVAALDKLLQLPVDAGVPSLALPAAHSPASEPATRPRKRVWLNTFVIALLGGAVPTFVGASVMMTVTPTSPPPQVLVEPAVPRVPADPVVEILARVQADEFAAAEKLWREATTLTKEESLALALACVGRAKELRARDQAKASQATSLAMAIGGRLDAKDPGAGSPVDAAIKEYYVEAAAREP